MRLNTWILQTSRLFTAIALLAGPSVPVCAGVKSAQTAQNPALAAARSKIPLYFEANRGQSDASVKFFTRAAGYNLYLTGSEAVTVLPKTAAQPVVVRMKLKGANLKPAIKGQDILPGHTNYLLGNDRSKWQAGVEQYAKVRVSQVYPGIDMLYYGNQGNVEHDFIVAPGANPGRILMGFEGAKGLRLDAQGNLVLRVEGGELTYKAPALYQTLGNRRVSVKGRYVLAANKNVQFEVGNYIKTKELVIDPELAYSSFLGGSVDDKAYGITLDASGNVYVTGSVVSTDFSLGHLVSGSTVPQHSNGGGIDVFVTKIDPSGALLWSTYYGSTGDDIGKAIAVDSAHRIYITGSTSVGVTLPGATQLGSGGGTDAFIAQISANGATLEYAYVFGGPQIESGNGIAVDAAGNAYVTGLTGSMAAGSFPYTFGSGAVFTPGAAQTTAGGAGDAFVAKFHVGDGALMYSTYLGGSTLDYGNAISIDGSGNAYITGYCTDTFVDAVTYADVFKPSISGASDAFVAKLDPTGATFLYKTYIGAPGPNAEEGTAIVVESEDVVYVAGNAGAAGFPGSGFDMMTPNSYQQTYQGGTSDGFVIKLNLANSGINDMVYATFLGGTAIDTITGLALGSGGNIYVTGHTDGTGFPSVSPMLATSGNVHTGAEAFVTHIGPTGGTSNFSTFIGGDSDEAGQGIALDSTGNIYVAGWTNSTQGTFPQVLPFQAGKPGAAVSYDAFVAKIAATPPVDVVWPTISIAQPANNSFLSYTSTMVRVNYADNDQGSGVNTATLVVKINNEAVGLGSNVYASSSTNLIVYAAYATVQLTGLAPIAYTLDASIADNVGNSTNAVQSRFTVATTLPSIVISQPANGGFLHSTSTTAVINYVDAGGAGLNLTKLVVKLDGEVKLDGSVDSTAGFGSQATVSLASLGSGLHTVWASIADNSGNVSTAQNTFTVDLAAACGDEYFYPSPATGATGTFVYCMAMSGTVKIRVYNSIGDLAAKIEDVKLAGGQSSTLNTARLAPGVYLYLLEKKYGGGNSNTSKVKKFVVRH